MLQGQPAIEQVLPAFQKFVGETVLVAHNAAFDMKFLHKLRERTGIEFSNPVLDTLLLSAVAQPNQERHNLEAISERFGITIVGRHTALGDALVTGEALIKLILLLEQQGIRTFAEARAASQKTLYARISY
jgi:DNA polymerase-3 subunit epsilon